MTPEEQRIAIAEACGWTFTKIKGEFRYVSRSPEGDVKHPNFGDVSHLPDYLNDLNTMHEAEKTLDDAKYHAYTLELSRLSWITSPHQTDDHDYKERLRSSFSASTTARAEAFLRTLGKWRDE